MAAGFFFTGIMPNDSTHGWQALFHRIAQVRRLTLQSAPMQRLHDELQAHAQTWKTLRPARPPDITTCTQALGKDADRNWYAHPKLFLKDAFVQGPHMPSLRTIQARYTLF